MLEDEYSKEEAVQIALKTFYRCGTSVVVNSPDLIARNDFAMAPFVGGSARQYLMPLIDQGDSKECTEDFASMSISGGGIRAASYSLGVLKELSRYKLLEHYQAHSAGGFFTDNAMLWCKSACEKASLHDSLLSSLFSSSESVFKRFTTQEWALDGSTRTLKEEPDSNWVHDSLAILQRLENKDAYPDDYEAAIIFAEVKPFRGELTTRLLTALGTYIEQNRFVEDQDSLVALCSSIRKYAMNMPESLFEHYANWLLPTETATLHHEAEMEFAKGICWRLEFEPHSWPAEYPFLTKTLFDLVDSYLTPRLILQKSYANTAMFGMVALHIIEAVSTSNKALVGNLRKKMLDTGVKWFVEMVDDNVEEAIHYISERDADLAKKVSEIRQG